MGGKFDLAAALSLGCLRVTAVLLNLTLLLQQLGHFLLHAVGLRQRRNAGLTQNLIL